MSNFCLNLKGYRVLPKKWYRKCLSLTEQSKGHATVNPIGATFQGTAKCRSF